MLKQKGQVVLILILIMTVALSIGLSIVQKSLVDVSTASKVEQSSRAFSAAEAGIEKVLQPGGTCFGNCINFTENSSKASVSGVSLIPYIQPPSIIQDALELPPLAKEDVAQVWLADYNSVSNPPTAGYAQNTLDIYWGNSSTDKAAIEVTLVYYNGATYQSAKWFIDNESASSSRNPANGFDTVNCPGTYTFPKNTYQCKKTLDFNSIKTAKPAAVWMLIRVRLLYNSSSQPIAVQSSVICPAGAASCTAYSLPPQARSITSTGVSGETQRKVTLFQLNKVVSPLFDYAIFSAGKINK